MNVWHNLKKKSQKNETYTKNTRSEVKKKTTNLEATNP